MQLVKLMMFNKHFVTKNEDAVDFQFCCIKKLKAFMLRRLGIVERLRLSIFMRISLYVPV